VIKQNGKQGLKNFQNLYFSQILRFFVMSITEKLTEVCNYIHKAQKLLWINLKQISSKNYRHPRLNHPRFKH